MKVLLVAYEFPPSPSPQSLRWIYLCRELVAAGHEVHVLAPNVAGFGEGLPAVPEGLVVHRTFAGPLMGAIAAKSQRQQASAAPAASSVSPGGDDATVGSNGEVLNWKGKLWHTGLNWKGRLFERIKKLLVGFVFPDIRGEWNPWAKRRLRSLLRELGPDVVITSHEPASTLYLGLMAHRAGVRWIADLGDPVLAPYTPSRWRRRAARLEADVCRHAHHVTVTADAARELLHERHGLPASRCSVLTQGFDSRSQQGVAGIHEAGHGLFESARLELLYTGSFYGFRRVDALVDAVVATPGVRLSIACVLAPPYLVEAAGAHPESIRLLGFLPHLRILSLQRQADVLVNIANDDACQVPGKVYEYLGSGRPLLHLGTDPRDAAAALVHSLRRGFSCGNDQDAIRHQLLRLGEAKRNQALGDGLDLDPLAVQSYSWQALAARLATIMANGHVSTPPHRSTQPGQAPAAVEDPLNRNLTQ